MNLYEMYEVGCRLRKKRCSVLCYRNVASVPAVGNEDLVVRHFAACGRAVGCFCHVTRVFRSSTVLEVSRRMSTVLGHAGSCMSTSKGGGINQSVVGVKRRRIM
jgi:hypothetical protein